MRILEPVGARFDVNRQTGVDTLHTEERRERNRNEVILVLAKHAAQLFHHPNHHAFLGAQAQSFSQRIHAKEQLLDQRVTNEANASAMLLLGGREIAAALDRARVDVCHGGGMAGEVYVRDFLIAVAGSNRGSRGRADFFTITAARDDGLHVLEFNFAELQRLDDDVEIGNREGRAGDLKYVGA